MEHRIAVVADLPHRYVDASRHEVDDGVASVSVVAGADRTRVQVAVGVADIQHVVVVAEAQHLRLWTELGVELMRIFRERRGRPLRYAGHAVVDEADRPAFDGLVVLHRPRRHRVAQRRADLLERPCLVCQLLLAGAVRSGWRRAERRPVVVVATNAQQVSARVE